MASDLSLSLTVSAMVGGALSGLTNISRAMGTLRETTQNLTAQQRELGKMLERNRHRLSDATVAQLTRDYDRMGQSITRLTQRHEHLNYLQNQRNANRQNWENIKSQWTSAAASAGMLVVPVKLAIDFESVWPA